MSNPPLDNSDIISVSSDSNEGFINGSRTEVSSIIPPEIDFTSSISIDNHSDLIVISSSQSSRVEDESLISKTAEIDTQSTSDTENEALDEVSTDGANSDRKDSSISDDTTESNSTEEVSKQEMDQNDKSVGDNTNSTDDESNEEMGEGNVATPDIAEGNGEEEEDNKGLVAEDIRKRKETTSAYPCILESGCTIFCIAFNPMEVEVALAGEEGVKLYVHREILFSLDFCFEIEEELKLLTYDPPGNRLFAIDSTTLYVMQKIEGKGKIDKKRLFQTAITAMEAGSQSLVFGTDEGMVIGVNATSFTIDFRINVGKDHITCVRLWSHFAYAVSENYVYMIDLLTGKLTHENVHAVDLACGIVHSACFVGGSAAGELVMFGLTASKTIFKGTFKLAKKSSVACISNIDEDSVAVATDDGLVKMCSVFPNSEIGIIGEMTTFATHMAVSLDEEWLVASDSAKGAKIFKLSDIGDAPPPQKKRKPAGENQLQSSSHENKSDFFSSL